MRFRLPLLPLLLTTFTAHAQPCDCLKELNYLIHRIETISPSYFDQVNDQNRPQYNAYKEQCRRLAGLSTTNKRCMWTLGYYMNYFRDNHLNLWSAGKNLPSSTTGEGLPDDTLSVRRRLADGDTMTITPALLARLVKKHKESTLEGLWYGPDAGLLIGIVASKTPFREYAGFIIKGDNYQWIPGQLKFEFSSDSRGFVLTSWGVQNGSIKLPAFRRAVRKDTVLTMRPGYTYYKVNSIAVSRPPQPAFELSDQFFLKVLSDSTLYLRVPTCDQSKAPILDSIVAANFKRITSTPNLIIDVRDNGGGTDRVYQSLLPIMYKKPYKYIGGWRPNTPEYIKRIEQRRDELDDPKWKAYLANVVETLRTTPGNRIDAPMDEYQFDTVYTHPRRIGVIANQWVASSGEGLVYNAIAAGKAKLYGQNTGGVFEYSNGMVSTLPCLPVNVLIPTIAARNGLGLSVEKVGFTPDKDLTQFPERDWIDLVRKDLERQK